MSVFWPEPVVMSSSGISCQSAWDSLTCNLPQHTPIYSLHTPSRIQEPDNTHWISEYLAFACHRGSSHGGGGKNSGYSLGKKKKAKKKLWLDFCLVFPAAALATFYTMKKERKEKNVSCLLLFSQVSFMVLPLPALSEDESLSCAFGTLPAEPAIVNANRITCQSPPPIRLPPSPPGSGECFWSLCLLRKFPPASLLLAREHANPH